MRQYARAVDRALSPVLASLGIPLILAAAEPLDAIYRVRERVPGPGFEDGITGNPEHASPAELAAAARPLLDARYASELDEVRERFGPA